CPEEFRYGTTISKSGSSSKFPTARVPRCQPPVPAWNEEIRAAEQSRLRQIASAAQAALKIRGHAGPCCAPPSRRGERAGVARNSLLFLLWRHCWLKTMKLVEIGQTILLTSSSPSLWPSPLGRGNSACRSASRRRASVGRTFHKRCSLSL